MIAIDADRPDWAKVLAPEQPWQVAYKTVADKSREILDRLPAHEELTTRELAELLFPPSLMRGEAALLAQKRLYKALAALAITDLGAYASRGEPVRAKLGTRRPWRWHEPAERNPEAIARDLKKGLRCPHCGGKL